MQNCRKLLALAGWILVCAPFAVQAQIEIRIKADQPGARVNPALYGLMTEEINYSDDGGLYAELIRNRV